MHKERKSLTKKKSWGVGRKKRRANGFTLTECKRVGGLGRCDGASYRVPSRTGD